MLVENCMHGAYLQKIDFFAQVLNIDENYKKKFDGNKFRKIFILKILIKKISNHITIFFYAHISTGFPYQLNLQHINRRKLFFMLKLNECEKKNTKK